MFKLTEREVEIFRLMIKGFNNTEIGKILGISRHTAKSHVTTVIKKLRSNRRSEATFWAGKYNKFKKIYNLIATLNIDIIMIK